MSGLAILGEWVVSETDCCTCFGGGESVGAPWIPHEPNCGLEPEGYAYGDDPVVTMSALWDMSQEA